MIRRRKLIDLIILWLPVATLFCCRAEAGLSGSGLPPSATLNIPFTGGGGGTLTLHTDANGNLIETSQYNGGHMYDCSNWQIVPCDGSGCSNPTTVTYGGSITYGKKKITLSGTRHHAGCDPKVDQNAPWRCWDEDCGDFTVIGEDICEDDGQIRLQLSSDSGISKALVYVNAGIGSGGSGANYQLSADASGGQSGVIPHALGQLLNGGTVTVGIVPGSYIYDSQNRKTTNLTATVDKSTFNCGDTITITVRANMATPTPSPTPLASPSIAPFPTATPIPQPSIAPEPYNTPRPNNPGTTVTNGGTTMSGITNQDIYNDVKQALDDAGNRDSSFGFPNGSFDYGDSPSGENGDAGNGLQSAVDRFTNDLSGSGDGLMEKVDAIDSLSLPTSIGDKSSWAVTLPVLGELTIDLSTFDSPVWAFRSLCLAILVVGAWFAIVKIVRSGVA